MLAAFSAEFLCSDCLNHLPLRSQNPRTHKKMKSPKKAKSPVKSRLKPAPHEVFNSKAVISKAHDRESKSPTARRHGHAISPKGHQPVHHSAVGFGGVGAFSSRVAHKPP